MPASSRLGDIADGHGCFPPSPSIAASGDVFINSIPALRKGDAVAPHGCSNCPPHPRAVSGGSPSVYINGKPAARKGDGINCGGAMSGASGDVFMDELTPPESKDAAPCVRNCLKDAKKNGQAFVG